MRFGAFLAQNVEHIKAANEKRIPDERAVAPPRHCFRAHDNGPGCAGDRDQIVQRLHEFAGLHVIRVTAKGKVFPPEIWRVRTRAAKPAQPLHMQVGNVSLFEQTAQGTLVILGIAARSRYRPYVGQSCDSECTENLEKSLSRACRVPDRVDRSACHLRTIM